LPDLLVAELHTLHTYSITNREGGMLDT